MDELDLAQDREDFQLSRYIANQLERNAATRKDPPMPCEDCEELPRAILRGNTRGRFCHRCMAEHVQAGESLSFI